MFNFQCADFVPYFAYSLKTLGIIANESKWYFNYYPFVTSIVINIKGIISQFTRTLCVMLSETKHPSVFPVKFLREMLRFTQHDISRYFCIMVNSYIIALSFVLLFLRVSL